MATVTGYTAEFMDTINDNTVVDGNVVGDNLILVTRGGTNIDAGNVRGPQGIQGIPGPLTQAQADARYLNITGDIVKDGLLQVTRTGTGSSECIRMSHATAPYMTFYNGSTRTGYIQGQNDEFKICAETDNPMTFFTNGVEQMRLRVGTTQEILTLNGNPDSLIYFRQSSPSGTLFSYIGKDAGWGLRATGITGDTLLQSTDGDTRVQAKYSVDVYSGDSYCAGFLPQGHVSTKGDELEDDVVGLLWRADWRSLRTTTNVDGSASIYLNRQGAATGTGGGQEYMRFEINKSQVGSIARSPTGVAFNNTSDHRIKDVKGPITGALERIKLLNPVRAIYKEDLAKTEVDTFVAHEVSPAVPEAVTGEKDAVDSNGDPLLQQLDTKQLIPLLVASVKELSAKVDELQARLDAA